jgi:tRNA uracil 4-sulfurtransferase
MRPEYILLRLGELTLKGRNRIRFEHRVLQHIQQILKAFPAAKVEREHGRIYIALHGESYEGIAVRLNKVFGLVSYSPVLIAELELEDIHRVALEAVKQTALPGQTFKVSVRRANKAFPIDSQQMNQLVAAYVLQHWQGLKVDVHNPEVHLRVEIREQRTYIFTDIVPGLGGFPLGTNGKAMLMLSGGIDSPVAGYLALKKGLKVEAVHFHSFPYTSERAQAKVLELASKLAEYTGSLKVHMVPFTEMQVRLKEAAPENLLITLMRRAMLRITDEIARKEEALAVVTGESLGQVASQTLPSMNVIGQVTQLPILRPLVMMDKQEIIPQAEKLGTFDISIQPYEDCCTLFIPKSPSTNPNLRIVDHVERHMTDYRQLIEDAVARTEIIRVVPQLKQNSFSDLL